MEKASPALTVQALALQAVGEPICQVYRWPQFQSTIYRKLQDQSPFSQNLNSNKTSFASNANANHSGARNRKANHPVDGQKMPSRDENYAARQKLIFFTTDVYTISVITYYSGFEFVQNLCPSKGTKMINNKMMQTPTESIFALMVDTPQSLCRGSTEYWEFKGFQFGKMKVRSARSFFAVSDFPLGHHNMTQQPTKVR